MLIKKINNFHDLQNISKKAKNNVINHKLNVAAPDLKEINTLTYSVTYYFQRINKKAKVA